MGTRFIQRSPDAAAARTGSHAGIGVDADDNRLYYNADGTRRLVGGGSTLALTAAATLTAAQSGSHITLGTAAGFTVTLPALADGLRFRAYVKVAPTGGTGYLFITPGASGGANVMVGTIHSSTGGDADSEQSGGDTFTFVNDAAVIGDRVDIWSDGSRYYITAFVNADTGATITTTA